MENLPTVVQEWCNTRAHTHTEEVGGESGGHTAWQVHIWHTFMHVMCVYAKIYAIKKL